MFLKKWFSCYSCNNYSIYRKCFNNHYYGKTCIISDFQIVEFSNIYVPHTLMNAQEHPDLVNEHNLNQYELTLLLCLFGSIFS